MGYRMGNTNFYGRGPEYAKYTKAYDSSYAIFNNRWYRFWRPLGNSSLLCPNGYVTFKNAAVGEMGSTTDFNPKPPSPTPTPSTEGCYSNNYKNCIPNGYTSDGTSCNKVWLPNGAEKNCVALWGDCSGGQKCCGPANCFGDIGEASCVPPTSVTSNPTSAPPTCAKKGEFCKKNSDCCKSKCIEKKKKCKKIESHDGTASYLKLII